MFNFSQSRIASEVRANLPRIVDDALRHAPDDEHDLVRLAGQVVHVALEGLDDDDHLAEVQAHGGGVPSTGARTFHVSVTLRPIRERAAAAQPPAPARKPWTPADGPLALRERSPGSNAGNANRAAAASAENALSSATDDSAELLPDAAPDAPAR